MATPALRQEGVQGAYSNRAAKETANPVVLCTPYNFSQELNGQTYNQYAGLVAGAKHTIEHHPVS